MTKSRTESGDVETQRPPSSESQASGPPATDQAAAIDRELVGDRSIWAALFDGQFRLAVPCSRCGRWLTSAASKKHRIGSRCAARVDKR